IGHQAITALFVTAASFPVFFYALRRTLRKPDYSSILGGALAILFLVLGGHPQFMFYSLFFGLLYAAYLLFFVADVEHRKPFAQSVLVTYVLGAALSAFQLLPTFELTIRSVRDQLTYEAFVGQSLHPASMFTSLVSTRIYHLFPNDTSEAMFDVGLLVLLLALIGTFLAFRKAGFWIFLAVFSALLVLGEYSPLDRIMYYVPGFNLFRVSSRNGIALDFAIALLAAYGLHAIQQTSRRVSVAKKYLAFVLIPSTYFLCFSWMEERIHTVLWRAVSNSGQALPWNWETVRHYLIPLIPELFTILAGATFLAFLLLRFGRGRAVASVCIVLAFAHSLGYRNWIFAVPAKQVEKSLNEEPTFLDNAIVQHDLRSNQFRIALGGYFHWIDLLHKDPQGWHSTYVAAGGANTNMLKKIPSISGYTPLMPRGYSRLAGNMQMWGAVQDPDLFRSPALHLLNVKYVLRPPGDLGFPKEVFTHFDNLGEFNGFTLYRNPRAPGMFWGVKTLRSASEAEFWEDIELRKTDFLETALLMEPLSAEGISQDYQLPERIEFRQIDGNTMEVEVETGGETFLVSSHPFYPGWFAWIDGERARILPVNGLFAGLVVPPGSHRILLRYIPLSFWTGLLLGILSLGTFFVIYRKDLLKFAR
ncbi:YfhO family protein, partial [Acidobacteria bacterium AH-259-O06]|nr:YfhO family protein [Acidobacteria bacterium AH-259-O06]